jgi:hypothetical protein
MLNVKFRLRLPFDAQLPAPGPRRWAVLGMLAVGGVVALLVPVFFAVILLSLLRGR